jgi:hypothetical protein
MVNMEKYLVGIITASLLIAVLATAGLGQLVLRDYPKFFPAVPLIVVGDSADHPVATADVVAGIDIAVTLAELSTKEIVVPSVAGVVSVTGGAQIKTEARPLFIGDKFSEVKGTFLAKDIDILADGKVVQKDNKEISYKQMLYVGDQKVEFNKAFPDAREPKLNIKLPKDANVYTYKIVFSTGLDTKQIAGKRITILGTEYTFTPDQSKLTNTSLVIFGGGQEVTIKAGEEATVGGATIKVVGIASGATSATILVNGESRDVTSGEYITVGTVSIYVKAIHEYAIPEKTGDVVLYVGADQLKLEHGVGVTKGTETSPISGSSVTFQAVGDKIYSLTISYKPTEDKYVLVGESFEDPIFGKFKIKFEGLSLSLDAKEKDKIVLKKDGTDRVKLEFKNKAGESISQVIMKISGGVFNLEDGYGRAIYVEDKNWTAVDAWIGKNEYFLVNKGEYSHLLQYTSIDKTNKQITIKNVGTGESFKVDYQANPYIMIGEYQWEVGVDESSEKLKVDMLGDGKEKDGLVPLYTSVGAKIELIDSDGKIRITEHTFTHTYAPAEVEFNVTFTGTGSTVEEASVEGVETYLKDDTKLYYGLTNGGTYIVRDTDADSVTIYTVEEPVEAYVFVLGPKGAVSIGAGVEAGKYLQYVPITTPVAKLDTEVVTADRKSIKPEYYNSHLILVGDSAVNILSALAHNLTFPTYGAQPEYQAKYGIKTKGESIIWAMKNPFGVNPDQVVVEVAGWEAADTRLAALALQAGKLKEWNITTGKVILRGTELTSVVPEAVTG